MLLEEIREAFANLPNGATAELSELPAEFPALVYRTHGSFGVYVDGYVGPDIAESFSGARILVNDYSDGGIARRELRLECRRIGLRNEFAVVCAQFLDPGLAGENRRQLLSSGEQWWTRWRQLLGNSIREKNAYGVLGELLAYERLVALGKKPSWQGPLSGSHDIETPEDSYEVKSTISKYQSAIHVAGQFQLVPVGDKPLYLIHQRFEPGPNGDSVDSVCQRLLESGATAEPLEELLDGIGLYRGSAARNARFVALESRRYTVDAAFPRIVPASFIGGSLPKGIASVEYTVDLASLPSEVF